MPNRGYVHALSSGFISVLMAFSVAGVQLANAQPAGMPRTQGKSPAVAYSVLPVIDRESFEVTANLANMPGDTISFQFPIWAPGAYDIVNFGAYVTTFTATGRDGAPLAVTRSDTSTFRIASHGADLVTVKYRIHDVDTPPTSVWFCTSDVDSAYVFANGAAVFGYPAGHKDAPCYVSFMVPNGWKLAIGLDKPVTTTVVGATGTDRSAGVETFQAHDYDELIDMPFVMGSSGKKGNLQSAEFKVNGKRHTVTLMEIGTNAPVDLKELTDTTARIVKLVSDFFGDMPYDSYLFQHFIADDAIPKFHDGAGALEHRNSSSYLSPPPAEFDVSYAVDLATEIAHEYFHAWSPKRIHVHQLGPFDYQHPANTTSLWFAEGLTEYYCRILLMRGNMLRQMGFLGEFGQDIDDIYHKQPEHSMTEVSKAIATISQVESTPALYSRGPLIGLLLDAAIRSQTNNAKGLDDAMRFFNREYGKTGKTFGDDDIIPIIEQATGAKLADFYSRYIAGREQLPVDEYVPKMGLKYAAEQVLRPVFGAELARVDTGLRIVSIVPHGSADTMGLRANDIITQIHMYGADVPVNDLPPGFESHLASIRNNDTITIIRDGAPMKIATNYLLGPTVIRRLMVDPAAGPAALAIRRSIMGF